MNGKRHQMPGRPKNGNIKFEKNWKIVAALSSTNVPKAVCKNSKSS
jgi:hypothetical protein